MSTDKTFLSVLPDRIVAKHHSRQTEEAYVHWVRQYVRCHGRRHPREMGTIQVHDFLTHLARDEQVNASAQNQALAARVFRTGRCW
ncbi:phage integrase N-terminal SAM-like domain-containing protein [Gemmatimonas sp.]|uniref:phage integrase N-terminal SAM-like domain-containing protein n=1 Tax=Gemmatimonas sp. TaxID=1962908 RepID=UPI003562A978